MNSSLQAPSGHQLGKESSTHLLLGPADQGAPAQQRLEPGSPFPLRWVSAPKGQREESCGRALDGALQSRALKRKEKAAPQESPRARKKVMRVPATSLSCGSTCLEHTGVGALRKHQAKPSPSPSALCPPYNRTPEF